jgi:large subunit ribosomal protein L30e
MAKDAAADIKKMLKSKKLVIGTEKTLKNLKKGNTSKVYLTANCPKSIKDDIKNYAKLNKAELVELNLPNDELGVICKKPFSISVLSVAK